MCSGMALPRCCFFFCFSTETFSFTAFTDYRLVGRYFYFSPLSSLADYLLSHYQKAGLLY